MPRRDGSIRLHPEHGLNPTLVQCFWCGKDRGDIALLGSAYKGEAPRHMILDFEPCEACKAGMARGITFIECEPCPEGRPAICKLDGADQSPTGRWLVVKEDAVRDMPLDPAILAMLLERRRAHVEVEAFQKMFGKAWAEALGRGANRGSA